MSLNFAQFLTPAPTVLSEDYDGLEYRWKFLTFRPALFKYEAFLVAGILVYVLAYLIGKRTNESAATRWFEQHRSLLTTQFSIPAHGGGLKQDGYSDFFAFSTGRRGLTSLHTTLTLRPRHDLLQYAFQFLRGFVELNYRVCDEVELDFTFRPTANGVPDCVWGIVAKDELKDIRANRWDLTFTKTSDSPSLPPSLVVMSESADVSAALLKVYGTFSLTNALSDPKILPYFRSLTLTDQPRVRPSTPLFPSEKSRHLILSLALPPAHDADATVSLLSNVFQLIDIITGDSKLPGTRGGLVAQLRPDTRTKLKKVRDEVDKEIKEEAVKEKKEAEAEEKAAAKKKAQQEKLSRLSAADQQKELERERKRALRKTQGKMKVR